ncbi:hypothetical protein PRIC1_002964 [Phytophthora ramorum]
MASPMEEATELRASTTAIGGGNEPGTPHNLAAHQEERERGREEYLTGVQRRIESYENCAAAIGAATTSLQELSEHLDAMHLATQQLNALTGAEQQQENADEQPKRSWNASTKVTQPRHPKTATDRAIDDENEQHMFTRELLERAVSTAFGGLLQDSTLDDTAFPDVHGSQSSEPSSVHDKENTPPRVIDPAATIEAKLRTTLEASSALSANHRQRRRVHTEVLQQAAEDTRTAREFQRRMKHAAFEHRERKLAVKSLQARIQKEIQFLDATAADLEKREFLLDDAFEGYERALRLELGLADSANSSSKHKQFEASPRRYY